MFKWLVEQIFPTPRVFVRRICQVMLISFNAHIAHAEKKGEGITFGEAAMRALADRPGWKRIELGAAEHADTGAIIDFDLEGGNLMSLTTLVVEAELRHEFNRKRELSLE